MSVQINTYVMMGALLPYEPFKGQYDRLEPYMDSAFEGIHHHEGLCVLYDGMNGKFVAIGRVIAKSGNHRPLSEPVTIHPWSEGALLNLEADIRALIGPDIPFDVSPVVISFHT